MLWQIKYMPLAVRYTRSSYHQMAPSDESCQHNVNDNEVLMVSQIISILCRNTVIRNIVRPLSERLRGMQHGHAPYKDTRLLPTPLAM